MEKVVFSILSLVLAASGLRTNRVCWRNGVKDEDDSSQRSIESLDSRVRNIFTVDGHVLFLTPSALTFLMSVFGIDLTIKKREESLLSYARKHIGSLRDDTVHFRVGTLQNWGRREVSEAKIWERKQEDNANKYLPFVVSWIWAIQRDESGMDENSSGLFPAALPSAVLCSAEKRAESYRKAKR